MKLKNILITGASSGLGQALYIHYSASLEYKVFGASRRGPDIVIDFEDSEFSKEVYKRKYDVVLHCSGIMPLVETNKLQVLYTNFVNQMNLQEQLIEKSCLSENACVIYISSTSVEHPDEHQPMYAASKAAGEAYMKSLAKRYAKKWRFNCLRPGFFATNLVPGEFPEELRTTIPIGYEATPDMIIPIVQGIINSEYMTGSIITIDGGVSI